MTYQETFTLSPNGKAGSKPIDDPAQKPIYLMMLLLLPMTVFGVAAGFFALKAVHALLFPAPWAWAQSNFEFWREALSAAASWLIPIGIFLLTAWASHRLAGKLHYGRAYRIATAIYLPALYLIEIVLLGIVLSPLT